MSFLSVALLFELSEREQRERECESELKQLLEPSHGNNEQSKNNIAFYKTFRFYRLLVFFCSQTHVEAFTLKSVAQRVRSRSLWFAYSHKHTHTHIHRQVLNLISFGALCACITEKSQRSLYSVVQTLSSKQQAARRKSKK